MFPEGFGAVYAASSLLYFFAFTAPPVALGGLPGGLAIDHLAARRSTHQ